MFDYGDDDKSNNGEFDDNENNSIELKVRLTVTVTEIRTVTEMWRFLSR